MKQQRVRIYEHGAPEVMRYEPAPAAIATPPRGQVRLGQQAVGLNFIDTMFRDGTFSMPLPLSIGVEGAGVIEEVGEGVTGFATGDRVAYFFSLGAYANVRMIEADVLVKLPPDVATETAAALLTKGLTAWMLLKRVHNIKAGDTILVHGAAGGVGSLVTRWAKALGATVIATVGSVSKVALVSAHGIDHVLDASAADLAGQVRAIVPGGVDVVYEFVGQATFAQSILALRDGGHLVHVGNASGSPLPNFQGQLDQRGIRYTKPATSQYVNSRESLDESSADLFATWRAGVFGDVTPVRYAMSDVVRAHHDLAARRIAGPAILVP
ncbi:quinone oxidoreductase [Massilia sp. RP-1-19]|uniref:Quinone oxidoreductase n=1 Tax=Massilia polaris TaxID=2728846 RepID=A0A848HLL8_9BURK|nr:quinone oxidoreductase [Massilia polaris]NML62082.1 quinone oxidoreductase [Massilia polaris]